MEDAKAQVMPALVVNGAAEALQFYTDVFGAVEQTRNPGMDGSIPHATIAIGDSVMVVQDASPFMGTHAPPEDGFEGSPAYLVVYVPDVDAVLGRATERGATVRRPATDQFYGDRDGFIVDPFGHSWLVATHLEDVSPDELARRMQAMQERN